MEDVAQTMINNTLHFVSSTTEEILFYLSSADGLSHHEISLLVLAGLIAVDANQEC